MTRPGQPMNRDQAFRLALVVERRARTDATTWVARLQDQARLVARGRAEQVIEPSRSTDPLRAALSREWYMRVFQDQVRNNLGTPDPAVAVTPVETEHVAECLRVGVAYRIHGPDGSVVLNPDDPERTTGQTPNQNDPAGVAVESAQPARPDRWHREQLERLVVEQEQRRADDARMVGAAWDDLTPDQRTAFAVYFHEHQGTHGPAAYPTTEPPTAAQPTPQTGTRQDPDTAHTAATYTAVDTGLRTPVPGPPAVAAAAVFDQPPPAGPAEANTARLLVAQAFPRSEKPPTITTTGETRSTTTPAVDPSREDRSR